MWEDDFFFDLKRLRDKMEKALGDFSNFEGNMPATDIYETDEDIIIKLDMPGIKKEDIELLADENILEVKAERRELKEKRDENFYRKERGYRKYYRQIPLPKKINPDNLEAEYHNGVLTLTAEKKEKRKVEKKKIKIK